MKLYLDNCCFNRPFDDQTKLRIMLESEAKLAIQENIRSGRFQLIWSYIMDYENSKNPFRERREQIAKWKEYATMDVEESIAALELAKSIESHGLKKMDAMHIACALTGRADYFLTTDDKILRKSNLIHGIKITDPVGFIKEASL